VIRVSHVITGLEIGGAELMLARLLHSQDRSKFVQEVVSLTTAGPVAQLLHQDGVNVEAVGGRRGSPDIRVIARIRAHLRRSRPDVVQTWLYHSNIAGGMAAKSLGVPLCWGVRQMRPDRTVSLSTRAAFRANALVSRVVPTLIICCSEAVAEDHERVGFPRGKMRVVPNGYDLATFKPDPSARRMVRDELGLETSVPLVGHFSRFDPQKGHRQVIGAASIVRRAHPGVHLVLAGPGVGLENAKLVELVEAAGASRFTHLLGQRTDMPRLTAALDVAVSGSTVGEGFPNSLAEAMGCGVSIVATDVPGTRELVGRNGILVQPRSSEALADGICRVLSLPLGKRIELGRSARARMEVSYGIATVARAYESIYEGLVEDVRHSRID
jgi:glycosyltransferase involved in cell wall biosynthesis